MPAAKRTREEVIELIGEVFRQHGYDGASLNLISQASGLGRASLYHYFPEGKEQMGREVFEHIGNDVRRQMLDPLSAEGSAVERIDAWIRGVDRFYDGGRKNCLLGAMVLSGGADRYANEVAATFRALIDALTKVLREAGTPARPARRRAAAAVAGIQGALITARGMRDDKLFRQFLRDLAATLLPTPTDEHRVRS